MPQKHFSDAKEEFPRCHLRDPEKGAALASARLYACAPYVHSALVYFDMLMCEFETQEVEFSRGKPPPT